jgi:hypothetical protein
LNVSADEQRPVRKRLHNEDDYLPWIRAEQTLSDCFLFWIPVSGFPIRHDEKVWLIEFLTRLDARLKALDLRTEIFFQYKQVTQEMGDSFRSYAQRCMKLLGLGRFADADLPSFPTAKQVQEAVDSGKPFDFRDWIGDYLIWFIGKQPAEQRERFLGHGGMTTIYLPPDPRLKPIRLPYTPALRAAMPIFQQMDVDAMVAGTQSMNDAFLAKSKKLFGEGLEDKPEYPGIPFVLPLLDSQHFFIATPELRERWFSLFDVYVNESRKDNGFLLAFQKEAYEDIFLEILESMRNDDLKYGVVR